MRGELSSETDVLADRRRQAQEPGPAEAVERQRSRGKLMPRDRIDALVDPGSFDEVGLYARHRMTGFGLEDKRFDGDGVVTGFAQIAGRPVAVFAQDPTVIGGSLGDVHGHKIASLMGQALERRVPIIGLNDGGGARLQEGVVALNRYGQIFRANTRASGVVPQISVALGATTGGGVYSPALTDFVVMVRGVAQMSITGPDPVRAAVGETVTLEQLGGADVHTQRSGVAHFATDSESDALDTVRSLLSFLPSHREEQPPPAVPRDPVAPIELSGLLDAAPILDPERLVAAVFDDAPVLEYHAGWARNLFCAFARLDGAAVAVVATNPGHLGGRLDTAACAKAARFVRTADAFNLPVVVFVDSPGFLPTAYEQQRRLIPAAAGLAYAFGEADTPVAQITVGRAVGEAWSMLGSRSLGTDLALALHGATFSPDGGPATWTAFEAAEAQLIDDIVVPSEIRGRLRRLLTATAAKDRPFPRRKHGNIPL